MLLLVIEEMRSKKVSEFDSCKLFCFELNMLK